MSPALSSMESPSLRTSPGPQHHNRHQDGPQSLHVLTQEIKSIYPPTAVPSRASSPPASQSGMLTAPSRTENTAEGGEDRPKHHQDHTAYHDLTR